MPRDIITIRRRGGYFLPIVTGSAAFNNFIARAPAQDTTHRNAYKALLDGLTTDGFFDASGNSTLLDALYIFATSGRTTAVLNLVSSSFQCVENGTVNFTADQGYTGDGSTFFLNTQCTVQTTNYVQNSASQGAYSRTNNNDPGSVMGDGATVVSSFVLAYAAITYSLNGGNTVGPAISDSSGMWATVRTASNAIQMYHNASSTAFDSSANASSGINAGSNIFVFAQNNSFGSTPAGFNSKQMTAAFIGAALTGAQYAALAARINTWMTTFGINVY